MMIASAVISLIFIAGFGLAYGLTARLFAGSRERLKGTKPTVSRRAF
jgi:hypothetical protein